MAKAASETSAASKRGGGKLSRSETVTVRLDPKLNYLCELGARAQRRTKSSFIEWVIDEALKSVTLPGPGWDERESIASLAHHLWDVEEVDRLIMLAENAPVLMSHEEQLIWKVIQQTAFFWRGSYGVGGEWVPNVRKGNCVASTIRDHWDKVRAVADGRAPQSDLPVAARQKLGGGFADDLDDDVPF